MKTHSWFAAIVVILSAGLASGQVALGTPPFGSFGGGPFDNVNLGNLNVHFAIPVLNKAGRGVPFTYNLSYDSSVWVGTTSSGTTQWQPVTNWGWRGITEGATGYISKNIDLIPCTNPEPPPPKLYSNKTTYFYHDSVGVTHPFNVFTEVGPCSTPVTPPVSGTATDGSGYTLSITLNGQGDYEYAITSTAGKILNPPVGATSGAAIITDANGNQVTATASSGITFYDTLSSTTPVLTVAGSGTPSSPTTYSYTAPSGASAAYTMEYTQYTVQTNFRVATVSEYGPLSNALVTKITLPDGTYYSFTYEATPGSCTPLSGTTSCVTGRLASVKLPTGGTIDYTYATTGGTSNTGIFADGSLAGLTRQLSTGGTWHYTRSLNSGTPGPGSTWTTTVVDPNSNYTVINAAEDGANGATTAATYFFYETQRQIYQGNVSANACSNTITTNCLLLTKVDCYNANYASCATASVTSPITQTDRYRELPNGSIRLSQVLYNSYGLVTDDKEYNYGVTLGSAPSSSFLVRETSTAYASLGNGIVNKPSSVTIYDWTSGSKVTLASSSYTYDQGTVTATSGTPQHVSITGSRGNLTTATSSTSSSTSLSRTYTYYDTGNPYVSTDVNSAQTTYVYGSGSCGNSFPTTIDEPQSLSRSMTWNCTGGITTQVTDENGNKVSASYTDPDFWRPASVTDQMNNQTKISYIGETAVEAALNFNSGNSVSDFRTTVDDFGRPILSQRLQGPGATNYDTAETDYNNVGLSNRSTMLFSATAGTTSSSAPGVNSTYDALGRVLTSTDADSGEVSYTYTNNDVLQAVSGGQTFQKQFEYDGLGRLTSVCEISSTVPGNGACQQSNAQTGLWTKYTYDALGHLLKVTQNAQASSGQQTRSFTYDMLGRMTSETNPESGKTTYTYDSATNPCGWGSYVSSGDLIQKTDANGNSTCYQHNDGLHRLTDVGNSNQSTTNACKRFRYDNSQGYFGKPSGVVVNNPLGRLAEALTDTCAPTSDTMVTDEWFSYDADGNLTDVYEATPHSGGYYHTQASYWANGALDTLALFNNSTGASFIPTQTYGVEGEGRTASVTAASGQSPVSTTTYVTGGTTEPIGSLTQVTFGSQDSDSYQYDPNTGRMTQYSLNVNGQSAVGTLQWNANGTLQQLAITDPFNSADNQTCTNTYDDLARLSGNNCGSAWAQTFTYDPFGNVTKSGSVSWLPGYNSATNQYTLGGTSYDNNGDLLNDTFNTYTWDVYGDLASANGGTATYDALGRMVENQGGTYQYVYGPNGQQALAVMQGQSLTFAYVPLPAGAFAMYNSSGLFQYNHGDWLGSARLFSTPSRTAIPAMAYAPFGEGYAGSESGWVQFTGTGNSWTVTDGENQSGSLDDFMFRRYAPVQGRWISPDPAGTAAVDPTNPQSWNRYAYVMNNPVALIDPTGLCTPVSDADPRAQATSTSCGGGGGGGGDTYSDGSGDYGSGDCYVDGGVGPCSIVLSPVLLGEGGLTVCRTNPCVVWNNNNNNNNNNNDQTGDNTDDDNGSQNSCGSSDGGTEYSGGTEPTDPNGPTPSFARRGFGIFGRRRVNQAQSNQNSSSQSGSPTNSCKNNNQSNLNNAANAAWHTFLVGEGVGAVGGCGVGVLVATGATAATETWPLGAATVPAGCVGGSIIGATEALPWSLGGAIVDFAWTYWHH